MKGTFLQVALYMLSLSRFKVDTVDLVDPRQRSHSLLHRR
jgi:hypothetical protein